MYTRTQKQQLHKYKLKTHADWHIVVKHTKHPAARKLAGHVQCELTLVFHTSCGFQEKERVKRNGKKENNNFPSAEPYNHKHQLRPGLTAQDC